MKTIAFIPVRKGSKGIPGKNLNLLDGKPLVCWILDTVVESAFADSVWVATDCDEMERLVRERYPGLVNVFRRSAASATDTAPSILVVQEFLEAHPFDPADRFVLLQATSPFTSAAELQALKAELAAEEYDSFVACYRLKKFRWSEAGHPLDYAFTDKPRRQDYKGLLMESGAYYVSSIGSIRSTGQLLSGKVKVVEISQAGMIDIDEPADWRLAEWYIHTYLHGKKETP